MCCIWDDADPSIKRQFVDSLQHRVLARAMGVRRSTSAAALQVETGIPPLGHRRSLLTARSYARSVTAPTRVGRLVRAHRDGL